MQRQFTEIYSAKSKTIFSIHDVLDNQEKYLLPEYSTEQFYCPSCHHAPLTFVTGSLSSHEISYFKTKNNAQHDPGCFYTVNEANSKESIEYWQSLTDPQIQDKLDVMIRYQLNCHKSSLNTDNQLVHDLNNALIFSTKQEHKQKRVLTRALSTYYQTDSSEYNTPILFYGKALLRHPDENDKPISHGNVLILFPFHNNRLVERPKHIFLHSVEVDFSTYHIGQPCYLAMLMQVNKNKKKKYIIGKLFDNKDLRFYQPIH